MNKQSLTDSFDFSFQQKTMMGPNALRIVEEELSFLEIAPGARILDLGCGAGLSSLALAKQTGATVFAADLWIEPSENLARFEAFGLGDRITPISVDATQGLPFAHRFFDVLHSIDAYHYFGANETMLPSLVPYVKRGGIIAIAVPGLKKEFESGIPNELKPFWQSDMHFHSCAWWRELWGKAPEVEIEVCREMDCCAQAWADWLTCSENSHAVGDREMMKAEGGHYFNLVQLVARIK